MLLAARLHPCPALIRTSPRPHSSFSLLKRIRDPLLSPLPNCYTPPALQRKSCRSRLGEIVPLASPTRASQPVPVMEPCQQLFRARELPRSYACPVAVGSLHFRCPWVVWASAHRPSVAMQQNARASLRYDERI